VHRKGKNRKGKLSGLLKIATLQRRLWEFLPAPSIRGRNYAEG